MTVNNVMKFLKIPGRFSENWRKFWKFLENSLQILWDSWKIPGKFGEIFQEFLKIWKNSWKILENSRKFLENSWKFREISRTNSKKYQNITIYDSKWNSWKFLENSWKIFWKFEKILKISGKFLENSLKIPEKFLENLEKLFKNFS